MSVGFFNGMRYTREAVIVQGRSSGDEGRLRGDEWRLRGDEGRLRGEGGRHGHEGLGDVLVFHFRRCNERGFSGGAGWDSGQYRMELSCGIKWHLRKI